jgi:tRNA(Ile)-lysidine synthase
MASSRKSKSDLSERIADVLVPLVSPAQSILLGLSGGLDSVVLLHLLHQLAKVHNWQLRAMHVHHGLSPNAEQWAVFCRELCKQFSVPLQIEHVDIAPLRDKGIEAAARQLRHAALNRQPVDFIALAHHRDDQIETLLLQLLRGAGVKGAAAMPIHKSRPDAPGLLRPLLDIDRAELLAYAQQQGLQWVEDESNADEDYPRNFLRHRVLPLIEARFPAYRETLARSTGHFAEANTLLDELATQDALAAVTGERLTITALRSMSEPRAKNLLRYFILNQGAPLPDASRLTEMLHQLSVVGMDNQLCITWQGWQLRCYRDHAFVLRTMECIPYSFTWFNEEKLVLPYPLGVLQFRHTTGSGISLGKLQQAPVTIRSRHGGEHIRLHGNAHRLSLKNLMQQHAIPPWLRGSLPLLFCGDELVWIDQVGIAAAYIARPDEIGIEISR